MYYHEIRLSYKIHAPILTIYASDIWTFSRNRITVNLVWKTQKSNLELPSCSFAILRCSFTKFGILFIPQYITIILCSFFLVLITFLPWHIIMHVFEVFFPVNSHQACTDAILVLFPTDSRYILIGTWIPEIVNLTHM